MDSPGDGEADSGTSIPVRRGPPPTTENSRRYSCPEDAAGATVPLRLRGLDGAAETDAADVATNLRFRRTQGESNKRPAGGPLAQLLARSRRGRRPSSTTGPPSDRTHGYHRHRWVRLRVSTPLSD